MVNSSWLARDHVRHVIVIICDSVCKCDQAPFLIFWVGPGDEIKKNSSYIVTVTWQSHDSHMTVTWQSQDSVSHMALHSPSMESGILCAHVSSTSLNLYTCDMKRATTTPISWQPSLTCGTSLFLKTFGVSSSVEHEGWFSRNGHGSVPAMSGGMCRSG